VSLLFRSHFHRVGSYSNHFPSSLSLLLPLRKRIAICTRFTRLTTRSKARWATPSNLRAISPRAINVNHTISTKFKCLRFVVLFGARKQSLSPTNHKDMSGIRQSLKERLGRARQWLPSFLGRLGINRKVFGIAAQQGRGQRV